MLEEKLEKLCLTEEEQAKIVLEEEILVEHRIKGQGSLVGKICWLHKVV